VGAYAVRRLFCAAVLFFGLATVTFVIFFVLPHTAPAAARRRAPSFGPPLGIHGSVVHEFGQFLSRIVHADLGRSSVNGHSVTTIVTTAAPATAGLVLGAAVIWLALAIPLGLLSALRPASRTGKASRVLAVVGLSVQPLWLGLVLSWVFGDQLGWFPPGGYCDFLGPEPDCGGPLPWAYRMVLPWTVFAVIYGAFYVRMIRGNARERLRDGYVRTAAAKGVSDWRLLGSHVLATMVRPVLSALVLDAGGLAFGLIGVTIFVEVAFGIPGLGRTTAQAAVRRDSPVLIGIMLFVAATVAIANLVADLVAAMFDLRISRRLPATEAQLAAWRA
jgi:peptide/nickel transport system permease protein